MTEKRNPPEKVKTSTHEAHENDFWIHLPATIKLALEKSLQQAKNGQTKSYEEVKKLIKHR